MASVAVSPPVRWLRVLVVAIVVLCLAELVVRVRADALIEPEEWSIPEAAYKEGQISALAAKGGASLIALGSSAIDVAFDPNKLTPLPSARPAYNAGIGGSSMAITAGWGEFEAVPRLKPDIAIVGITSRELNPNDEATSGFTRGFHESRAYLRLSDTESALQRVERRLEDVSELFRYRTVLRQPSYLWNLLGPGNAPVVRRYGQVNDAGQKEIYLRDTYKDRAKIYKSTALFKWELGSEERDTLAHLLRYLQANVKHVLVVSMPVTPVYVSWSPHGQDDIDAVNATLRRLAASTGAEFVDAGVWPTEYFADAGHVNGAGSARFTTLIDAELQRLGWR